HCVELPHHIREHVRPGGVRRSLHLCALRHHLALCGSDCCTAFRPTPRIQRQC
ncbi:hypothetical protein MHYP_G00072920, partial [Metynnis hypsauchen]